MKFKCEMLNKFDIMKAHSVNFLENEKKFSQLVHENNVRKVEYGFGKEAQQSTEKVERLANEMVNVAEENRPTEQPIGKSEVTIVTSSLIDVTGSAPKRYTTRCFITLKSVPCWFSESLTVDIASGKKEYDDNIFYKEELQPTKWSESMTTEVNTFPKKIVSESSIPIVNDEQHIPLEAQQLAASASQ